VIFAELPLTEAEGAILAHGFRLGKLSFKKGRVLSAADVAALAAAGRAAVVAARFEPGDVPEDAAASQVAAAARGANVRLAEAFTGRCNLFAETAGLLVLDRERVDAMNLIDEALTVATLAPYEAVEAGRMVATVKIIPFAVPDSVVERCAAIAADGGPLLRVATFRPRPVGLVQTRLAGTKESVLDKTVAAVNDRLAALGCAAVTERRCAHETAPLAEAIAELASGAGLLLVSGASAITDRRDVVPAAIERAGGRVEHFGMPVDPGNLLLLARLGATPVLGLPGCARSPKLNGFDWVLQRLLADLAVSRRDIMLMGAGGLLMEIPTRPQPRAGTGAEPSRAPRVGAVVLAAGRSSRMGAANKLLAEVDGASMVAHAVDAALASRASAVVVVTGHDSTRVRAALAGREVTFAHNSDPAAGLSLSLQRGLAALGPEVDGALICLADMPRVGAAALDRLIAAFDPLEGRSVCVPVWNGKRGNPVLWARRFFAEMAELAGDTGARHLIGAHAEFVCEVAMPDDAVLIDVDTPEALAAARARADDRPA